MKKTSKDIPPNWICVDINEIFENIPLTGKNLKKKEYLKSGDLPVIDQGQEYIAGYTERKNLEVSCSTPCIIFGDHTRILKFVNFNFVAGADGVKVMRPFKIFNPKFFFYFLKALQLPDKGYARHFQYLVKASIPLPPLPEQHKIVEKIEELFTKLDAGVEALKKIKKQIKQYRQSVLKSAFEGKLTEEWREKNKNKLEPASVLLKKIEEQPIKNKYNTNKKMFAINTESIFKIPDIWEWIRIGGLCYEIRYGTSDKASYEFDGVPVLRMGDINDGKIDFEDLKFMPENWSGGGSLFLEVGDVLFNRTNSFELVGKTAVFKGFGDKVTFASYLVRLKFYKDLYRPELSSYYINSLYGRKFILSLISQQVGQANVSASKLTSIPIPLMAVPEQQKIVEEIEKRFSIADEVEKTVDKSLEQAEKLRQSILKKAFEGKLTEKWREQYPKLISGENSAEKLLEKIKKEKEKLK